MAKLFDLSPLEELEIMESGTYEKEGIVYQSQELGDDLVMVWAFVSGVRQRESIGIQKSTIQDRITQYKLKQEALDKQVQIRMSTRLYNDLETLAESNGFTVAEFIRIMCQRELEKNTEN